MKLNKREKILIYVLIFSIILYTFLNYDIGSLLYGINRSFENNHQIAEDYKKMSDAIRMKENNENSIKDIKLKIENSGIDVNLDQEDVIAEINEYIAENNISVKNLSFSEIIDGTMNEFTNSIKDEDATELNHKEEAEYSGKFITEYFVEIEFECSYENLLKFIEKLQNGQRTLSIKNIYINFNNYDFVTGNINISYYSMTIEDIEYE